MYWKQCREYFVLVRTTLSEKSYPLYSANVTRAKSAELTRPSAVATPAERKQLSPVNSLVVYNSNLPKDMAVSTGDVSEAGNTAVVRVNADGESASASLMSVDDRRRWMKMLRLQKYAEPLSKYSFEEVVTSTARHKHYHDNICNM